MGLDGEDMGFIGNMKEKMAVAGAAESAHPLIPNEVNRAIGQIGWILQSGQEIDVREHPEPNPPANARNAVKKFQYNYLNFSQSHVKVEMYLVYMSPTAMDCAYFTYVNGATAATFRMQDFVQIPPGGSPMLINRERLDQEVRGFLQAFGSLIPPPPVQQVVMAQPQPMVVMAGPQPQPMVVTTQAQPQVMVAQSPPPMVVQQTGQQIVQCPRCGTQFQISQTVTQTGYTQTTYGSQPMAQQPPPQRMHVHQQPPPQNVTIQMSGMQQQPMGQQCPACGRGPIDTMTNRCTTCGWQF